MTISYPISAPTLPKHSSIRWIERNNVGISESPISFKQDVFDWDADKWIIQVSIDPLTREEAAPWSAFLSALKGRRGTFLYGDILTASPQGLGGGTPKVNGNLQTGRVLITDGWPNSTLVLKAGDRFQVNNSLYKVLSDATTNGSGQVSIDVWPSLRAHADNADLILSNPKCIFRLTDNSPSPDDLDRSQAWNFSFEAEEAL